MSSKIPGKMSLPAPLLSHIKYHKIRRKSAAVRYLTTGGAEEANLTLIDSKLPQLGILVKMAQLLGRGQLSWFPGRHTGFLETSH